MTTIGQWCADETWRTEVITVTEHAKSRWQERFPEFDLVHEYAKSRRLGNGRLAKRVASGLSERHRSELRGDFKRTYYLISYSSGAVFVMVPPETVITVLKLPRVTG